MPMVVARSRQMLPAPHVVPKAVGSSLTGSHGPGITLNKEESAKSRIPLVFGDNLCQRHYKSPRSSSPAGDLEAPLGDSVIAERSFPLKIRSTVNLGLYLPFVSQHLEELNQFRRVFTVLPWNMVLSTRLQIKSQKAEAFKNWKTLSTCCYCPPAFVPNPGDHI